MGILHNIQRMAVCIATDARYSLPNFTQSWATLLVYLLFSLLLSVALIVMPAGIASDQLLTYIITMVPPFIYLLLIGRRRRFDEVPVIRADYGRLSTFSVFFMVTLLALLLQIATDPLTSWMTMPDYFKKLLQSLINGSTSQIIAIVVAAPLLEELLLRGFIERGLIYHIGGTKAIVVSAVIFGVMHFNPWQALPAFIIGLALGWIYWRTHNLWLTILMHFITNGTSVVTTRLFPQYSMSDSFLQDIMRDYAGDGAYVVLVSVCAALAAVLFYCLNRKLSNGKELFPMVKKD